MSSDLGARGRYLGMLFLSFVKVIEFIQFLPNFLLAGTYAIHAQSDRSAAGGRSVLQEL